VLITALISGAIGFLARGAEGVGFGLGVGIGKGLFIGVLIGFFRAFVLIFSSSENLQNTEVEYSQAVPPIIENEQMSVDSSKTEMPDDAHYTVYDRDRYHGPFNIKQFREKWLGGQFSEGAHYVVKGSEKWYEIREFFKRMPK
jgi:hypothetical protein